VKTAGNMKIMQYACTDLGWGFILTCTLVYFTNFCIHLM